MTKLETAREGSAIMTNFLANSRTDFDEMYVEMILSRSAKIDHPGWPPNVTKFSKT